VDSVIIGTEGSLSIVERLKATNAGLEIWWDSSPLVYETWRREMLAAAAPERRETLAAELLRLWDPRHPERTQFGGVTTNPPLSLAAMRDDPERWRAWIREYVAANPGTDVETVFWALYREIVRLGAEMMRPLYEASGKRLGHLSGQVDPRSAFDGEAMLRQGLDIATLGPNVMVKVPGTTAGMAVLRELTRRGIATNCTLAFTVPQFVAVAENVQAGLLEARAAGVDLSGWKSVMTDMTARWENSPTFVEQAREAGVELTLEDRRWAGIAIFKHGQDVYRRRAYQSKMLLCSVRVGPTVDGQMRCWHVEETAGGDVVMTLPPGFLTELIGTCGHLEFSNRIGEDIPADVMARLRRVPYFNRGYDVDGTSVAEFDEIAPLRSTFREFSDATGKMVDFVRERMA
jgi:transaldolase